MIAQTFPPNAKQLFDLVESGGAFETAVVDQASAAATQCQTVLGDLQPFAGQDPLMDDLITQVQGLSDVMVAQPFPVGGGGGEVVNGLEGHLSRQFEKLPTNLNIATSALSMDATVEAPGFDFDDICAGIQDFMGSILGGAAALIDTALGFLGQIGEAISQGLGPLLALAAGLIGQITSLIGDITNMIASELAKYTSALGDLLKFGSALSLPNLFDNPCGQVVLSAVGSTTLIALLTED